MSVVKTDLKKTSTRGKNHLETSREVEDRMLELAPCADGQFRRGTSSPDHAILDMDGRRRYGPGRYQRDGANRPEELRAREGLEIRLGEIDRGRSRHPGDDRSGHSKLGRNRRRWNPVDLLFWRG